MFAWKTKTKSMPRRMMEQTGAYNGCVNIVTNGLITGTCVGTSMGWRQIEAIAVGDMVLTFDNGLQAVTEVTRSIAWSDAPWTASHMWPVHIPAGALGNRVDMSVLADQGLMIESDAAMDQYGDPFAIVPALALVGTRGITRQAPRHQIEIITLSFENEQVVYAEGNVLVHCLASNVSLSAMLDADSSAYDVVSIQEGTILAEHLILDDHLSDQAFAG